MPSSDNLLELQDSDNLHQLKCYLVFFSNPYFLICLFGIFEVNTGRIRPPSPSCSTSMIPYWRGGVEMSILKNKVACCILLTLRIVRLHKAKSLSSKHLTPSRYCAGRMAKHQWIGPASASENGWLPPLGCPLAATCMHVHIRHWKITKIIMIKCTNHTIWKKEKMVKCVYHQ